MISEPKQASYHTSKNCIYFSSEHPSRLAVLIVQDLCESNEACCFDVCLRNDFAAYYMP